MLLTNMIFFLGPLGPTEDFAVSGSVVLSNEMEDPHNITPYLDINHQPKPFLVLGNV